MESRNIMLKCDCNAETLVFTKYQFAHPDAIETNYEISIEDAFCGSTKVNRFKRAWYAFWAKPIVYASVYKSTTQGKRELKQWLKDCLYKMEE